ncbi:membrane protein [gut metagenome]|uniref:Membrane protein n=1 Tax=gut metagenome TaxID=749906 RepID=J9G646_9ZZZZ
MAIFNDRSRFNHISPPIFCSILRKSKLISHFPFGFLVGVFQFGLVNLVDLDRYAKRQPIVSLSFAVDIVKLNAVLLLKNRYFVLV